MPSGALSDWKHRGLARLAELESLHLRLTGTRRGRRWGTTQLNRSLIVALCAQFQSFCRNLHDAGIEVQLAAAPPAQREMLEQLLINGRKLETGNPRRSALAYDFNRLGFPFLEKLKSSGPSIDRYLAMLEDLLDLRNAIGHGNEAEIARLEAIRKVKATKASYLKYRSALIRLATTIDRVVAQELANVLSIRRPW